MSDSNIVTYLADKLTVDEIKTLVEYIKNNSKDSDILTSLTTIDGEVDNVRADLGTINTNASAAATDAASIKSTLSTVNTNIGTANTNINSILSKLSSSSGNTVIKSYQAGQLDWEKTSSSTKYTTLTITSVDTSKSIIILHGDQWSYKSGASSYNGNNIAVKFNSSTQLKFGMSVYGLNDSSTSYTNSRISCSWQVIEFY